MRPFRQEKISSLIREELNKLILREIETPGVLVTVTEVRISKDIDRAIVKFSTIPSEKAEEVLEILRKAKKQLQFKLLRKINIKPMPQLEFVIDRGPEEAAKVEKALLKDQN